MYANKEAINNKPKKKTTGIQNENLKAEGRKGTSKQRNIKDSCENSVALRQAGSKGRS